MGAMNPCWLVYSHLFSLYNDYNVFLLPLAWIFILDLYSNVYSKGGVHHLYIQLKLDTVCQKSKLYFFEENVFG